MRRTGWLALAVAALSLTPAAGGQALLLEGTVSDPSGQPIAGAVLFLHGAQRGTLSDPAGSFVLPSPEGEDVLVAVADGRSTTLHYVNRTAPSPLRVTLPAVEPPGPPLVRETLRGRFGVVPFPPAQGLPLGGPVQMGFSLGAGAAGASLNITWPDAGVNVEATVTHNATGEQYAPPGTRSPLLVRLPASWLRERPGDYGLELRLANGTTQGMEVLADLAIAYGPWSPRVVQGAPPDLVDPADNPADGFDILGARFTNETADGFDVVLGLRAVRSETLAPPAGAAGAAWMVLWGPPGDERFVAFEAGVTQPGRRAESRTFAAGQCLSTFCTPQYAVPGEVLLGDEGALRFRVPKAAVGSPQDGSLLDAPRAYTLSGPVFPLPRSSIDTLRVDEAGPGRAYLLGPDAYAVTPATVASVRAALSPGPAAPLAPLPLVAGLLLVIAAAVGIGVLARRRPPPVRPEQEKYERLRLLGEGASGRTYLAKHRDLGKLVAIKELRDPDAGGAEGRERLVREARIAGGLKHPNVVEVYDIEERPGGVALVMEYVDGGSLDTLLGKGRLEHDRALRIWDDLLAGLEAIHAAGVVHRDVKPSNILLTKQGTAKLADFGVARSPAERTLGGAGPTPIGTPMYMAPEQLQGLEPSEASDLYAATAVAYRMLTGRPHLELAGREAWEVLMDRRGQRAALPVPDLPAWLNKLLEEGLAERPAARPRSAAQMRAALARGLALRGARRGA